MREDIEYLNESLSTGHIICISEGSAEEVIIKKLFYQNKLIFKPNDLYGDNSTIKSFSRTRQGKKFARENLEMDYGDNHINIIRVLDSKKEAFILGKIYDSRIKTFNIRIFNILTRPEIEMLVIINEGHYDNYTNKHGSVKPNIFCKNVLKIKDVKSELFIKNYFEDINVLIKCIENYKHLHSTNEEYCLFDLLE